MILLLLLFAMISLFLAIKTIHYRVAVKRYEEMLLSHIESQCRNLDTRSEEFKRKLQGL